MNVRPWIRNVILSTRKVNVDFRLTVYAQFLSYSPEELNPLSVLLFSDEIKILHSHNLSTYICLKNDGETLTRALKNGGFFFAAGPRH